MKEAILLASHSKESLSTPARVLIQSLFSAQACIMDSDELCRKCRNPILDCSTNMVYDKHGNSIRCPKCFDLQRKYDQQRTEWNQRVVFHVKKLDSELQDYYRYDLENGDLRNYLINMRESGRSPQEAVRAWRHKVMYLDAAVNGTRKYYSPCFLLSHPFANNCGHAERGFVNDRAHHNFKPSTNQFLNDNTGSPLKCRCVLPHPLSLSPSRRCQSSMLRR